MFYFRDEEQTCVGNYVLHFIGVALLRNDTSSLKITATLEWRLLPTDGSIIRVLASVVELVLSRNMEWDWFASWLFVSRIVKR